MGLLKKISEKRMKDPVDGTLRVVGINRPDPTATSANYHIDGVISGPGIEAQAVSQNGIMSTGKWPSPGQDVPVLVDRQNPNHFILQKDKLTTARQQATDAAQALAAQMRGEEPTSPAAAGGAEASTGVGFAPGAANGDATALAQQLAQQFGGEAVVTVNGIPMDPSAVETDIAAPAVQPQPVSAAEILARGIAGHATLLGTYPSPMPAPDPNRSSIGLMLNVLIDQRPPYQVQNLYAVPNEKVDRLTPGTLLPVKVDPGSDQLVAVDWEAF